MPERIKLGVSACLLGEKVRYDGGHKLDRYLADVMGAYVEWVPVCPEVEAGLGVPREPMRLVGYPDDPRLVTLKTGRDHTRTMRQWAKRRLKELKGEELSGFIFKSRSPSSGMERVRVHGPDGKVRCGGRGIFAAAFMAAFPQEPVEDERRLADPGLRDNFIECVFTYQRWLQLARGRAATGALLDFHTRHKYLVMAHSPAHLRRLGRLVAGARGTRPSALYGEYLPVLMEGMRLRATVRKNVNVLQHLMGHLKKQLSAGEEQELLEAIGEFRRERVPLIVPVTLMRHFVLKYDEPYLKLQLYLDPHPDELKLRNHA